LRSGLRRGLRNNTPVPMGGGGGMMTLPGAPGGGNTDLTLLRTYKRNGTVNSNVSLLASSVASQPWKMYQSAPQDGRRRYTTSDQGSDQRKEIIAHAALNVLNNPGVINVGGVKLTVWTRMALFEISGIWLETTGKSHWVVDFGAAGGSIPLGLWPVRPDRMMPVPDKDRYLAGWVYTSPDGREKIPLLPTEVIYNRYPDPEDPYGGAGPIGSVLTDIQAADYAAEWNKNYFVNSAEPGGVIQIDKELDEGEFNELVDRWRETHRGVARAHRIAVLDGGAAWIPNSHSPKDMDFSNLRGGMRDTIRESLGMHKVMTGVTEDVNRANAQTGEEVFSSWKVKPRLDRWSDVLNYQFLPLFGATAAGRELDYVYPMPQNREQDALELTSKSAAAEVLVSAGYDPADVLEVVGLPAMRVAERATQLPALPPAWVPAAPAAPGGGGDPGDAAAAALARLRASAAWGSPAWGALEDLRLRKQAAWNALAGAR
jgi:phage portal protein BeeE